MAREAQFNFIPETQLVTIEKQKRKEDHTVTVNAKFGHISFSPSYIRDKNLNGVYIKFYADQQKKALAWKILREQNLEKLAGYRKLNLVEVERKYLKKDGQGSSKMSICKLTLKRLIDSLRLDLNKKYRSLEIKEYNLNPTMGESFHYIKFE